MSLKPAIYANYWSIFGNQIKTIRFYDHGKVVADTDFGYLPATSDRYCGTAASTIAEIEEMHLARRNKPETGMAHGGHFVIRDVLYLDLSYFQSWTAETRKVHEGPGYENWVAGIEVEYTVLAGHFLNDANGPVQVRAFMWNRGKVETRRTPEADTLDMVCDWFNKNVADHPNRHLSASGAQRLLNNLPSLQEKLEVLREGGSNESC